MPGNLEVDTGQNVQQQQSQDVKDELSILTTFLLVFAYIAVFVAAFIIFNTFSITVAQRARQLALMRAIGASGAQVTRMVVAEALRGRGDRIDARPPARVRHRPRDPGPVQRDRRGAADASLHAHHPHDRRRDCSWACG